MAFLPAPENARNVPAGYERGRAGGGGESPGLGKREKGLWQDGLELDGPTEPALVLDVESSGGDWWVGRAPAPGPACGVLESLKDILLEDRLRGGAGGPCSIQRFVAR